eukprot:CAMPEP_0197435886 /NCGR_PEP_ID=MMETSP1175-20131217/3389_1 /TAXON_ID=1003142 /ORGANISM="Triceratium dubium, Strain CCMP147" /LENGTH=145 /DNA_ID=CAMNT_0042965027 /DNA_START=225 /DNA_END=662 /DNA_ORIENTATION=+
MTTSAMNRRDSFHLSGIQDDASFRPRTASMHDSDELLHISPDEGRSVRLQDSKLNSSFAISFYGDSSRSLASQSSRTIRSAKQRRDSIRIQDLPSKNVQETEQDSQESWIEDMMRALEFDDSSGDISDFVESVLEERNKLRSSER